MYTYQRKHYHGRAKRAYCTRYKISENSNTSSRIKGDFYNGYIQGHIDASYNPVSDYIFDFVENKNELWMLLDYANNNDEIKTSVLIKIGLTFGLRAVIALVKVVIIKAALQKALNNVSEAARILKIDRNTLNGVLKGSRIEKETNNGKS